MVSQLAPTVPRRLLHRGKYDVEVGNLARMTTDIAPRPQVAFR